MTSITALDPEQSANHPAETLQLPFWPESRRGGPNALLRSALFAGIKSEQRVVLGFDVGGSKEPRGVEIASQEGIKIRYAGTQLNQYDADVFFEAIHRARKDPFGAECSFRGADFLKAIGRTRNNLNYEDLEESFRRLRRGEIEAEWQINGRHYIFTGSLISHYVRETTSKLYKVSFAPQIGTLFSAASWTQLEWEQRKALKGKPLGLWLHSYWSTHADPFPLSVAFIQEKSGSQTAQKKHFKADLKRALRALDEKLGWKFTWKGDLVALAKPPSASQAKYIQRKKEKSLPAKSRVNRSVVAGARRKPTDDLTKISDFLPGILPSS